MNFPQKVRLEVGLHVDYFADYCELRALTLTGRYH